MIKQVLAGAAFATAATMAVAMPASAHTTAQAHRSPTDALQKVLATQVGQGPTSSGQGGTTSFGTRNGDTAVTGESGGILNNHGAPLGNVDGRCLVPLPEGEGIGGHLLGTIKNDCNIAPVDQFQAPQKLL
ncbi:hypothetical protein [Streptomyces sp. WM6378]|uniref:hypothetical protein n=1 Tax=Streptomyces sp. WM6378 TaxID=1415557 RepID=UPI0006AE3A67|nr:hypothetical protein [Streptomyces sp. WM6378]